MAESSEGLGDDVIGSAEHSASETGSADSAIWTEFSTWFQNGALAKVGSSEALILV
jgi:hypothetical protein